MLMGKKITEHFVEENYIDIMIYDPDIKDLL